MRLTDEDLGHGATPICTRGHALALLGIVAHVNLVIGDALLVKERLGRVTVRTKRRGVDRDSRHGGSNMKALRMQYKREAKNIDARGTGGPESGSCGCRSSSGRQHIV